MNKRRLQRAVLLTGFLGLLLVGGYGLWLFQAQRHQYTLNRQLIAALVRGEDQKALDLVNAGADPTTPYIPLPPPSFQRMWNSLLHRSGLPIHDDSSDFASAFTIACGEDWMINRPDTHWVDADAPQLVQAMLQHGAQKNAKAGGGWTPLMRSVYAKLPKTVEVLLQYGVDVNAQDANGYTALVYVVMFNPTHHHAEYTRDANLVRQLLAHGANPSLPDYSGITPLREAQQYKRPDLVALMRQAGAKK